MEGPGRRIAELARILNDGQAAARPADTGEWHLLDTCLDRVQRLERYVGERSESQHDDLDAVAMLLLLDQYAIALARLRDAARASGTRIDDASVRITRARQTVKQCLAELESSPVSAAPSAQPPASQSPDT